MGRDRTAKTSPAPEGPFALLSRRRWLKPGLSAGAAVLGTGVGTFLVLRGSAPSVGGLARVDDLTFAPATAPLISAHQQGTARMASSARDGAVSPDGLVYGTRNVFVLDSSVFPSSASSHTMAPIMTVARYLAHGIASSAR